MAHLRILSRSSVSIVKCTHSHTSTRGHPGSHMYTYYEFPCVCLCGHMLGYVTNTKPKTRINICNKKARTIASIKTANTNTHEIGYRSIARPNAYVATIFRKRCALKNRSFRIKNGWCFDFAPSLASASWVLRFSSFPFMNSC